MKNKNDTHTQKYLIRNVTYGDKDLIECMKAIIRNKLTEEHKNSD